MPTQPSCLQKVQTAAQNASQTAQSRRENRFNDALALKAEGQISQLKMIKRIMFGRAGFELLRARVLPVS
ncbi:transposase [Kozakia baliensis]|uniref:transposase n=1 Tax=Kozakia baliensis TaxID=153496 RepID=UPI001246B5D7|nr:transposase [Kozakia baliensis]